MFRAGRQVSWYEWTLPISSWDFTIRTFICPFCYDIFCHNSMTACHMMSKMEIWAIGPMAYVPTKFHWDSFKRRWNLTINCKKTFTTTTPIIITRGTVPWGTVNPIPIRLVTGTKDKVSPGNSRWQQLAPFERASVTSYSTLMVTMDLCASVSKLQPSEICLKCAWPPFDLWRSL